MKFAYISIILTGFFKQDYLSAGCFPTSFAIYYFVAKF